MVTEFPGGLTQGFSADTTPANIVTGSDGNLWFTEYNPPGGVAYMERSGVVHELMGGITPGFSPNGAPLGIAAGPDGGVLFTEGNDPGRIGYANDSGIVQEYVGGLSPDFSADSVPEGITMGADGLIWFTEEANPGRIAFIDRARMVHQLTGGQTFGFSANSEPYGITEGRDGNVWFTEEANPGRIAYVDRNGVVHQFTGGITPGFSANGVPEAITTGPDGHIWFVEAASPGRIAYIDGSDVVHEFTGGETPGFTATEGLANLTTGTDGNLWFTTSGPLPALGRINFTGGAPNGTVTEFHDATTSGLGADAAPFGITTGPDGNIWFTDLGGPGRLGRVNGPDATSGAATASGPGSASLTGTVIPNGEPITDCHFEYGTSTAYGTSVPCAQTVGGGTAGIPVTASAGNLIAGATYHYRVVATNAFGIGTGSDRTFTMPVVAPIATNGGGGTGVTVTTAPVLSSLRLNPSRFHAQRRGRHRTVATISYRDTVPAMTTFTIERCSAPQPHRARRCAVLGSFIHADRPGVNRVRFTGHVAGKPLGPGNYTLVAVAISGGTPSQPTNARFEVTR
jgi:streptogramin lyase